MSITSLRQALLTAGGTPTKYTHVELLRQLISTWGGTPTAWTVTALLRQAISNRSGTPTQYTQIGLLRELIAALGGTPVSYKADALWAQMAALATVGTPTLQVLNLAGGTITEGSAAGTVIGAILNTRVGSALSLSADAGGRFALSGGNLVAGATATDYETTTSHTVTVVETLAGAIGNPKSTVLTVNVTNVLDAPNLVALTGALSVPENSANGTVVGTPTGYTAGSTKSFSNDAGGRFVINASTGQITVGNSALLNYEAATSHNVTIVETLADSPNSPRATVRAIGVTNQFEQPNLGALVLSVTTYTAGTATSGTISGAATGSTITISGAPAGFSIDSLARTWAFDGSASAGSGNLTLTETLSDSSNSPNATVIGWTVNAATSSLLAPTVAFDTPTYANPPNLAFTLASDAQMDDWIGREFATNSFFSSSTFEWHQVTSDDIINGTISWALNGGVPFADGTLYVRAYAARGGTVGAFTLQSAASSAVNRAVYDATPNTWDFTDQTGVATSSTVTSNTVTPTGYTGAVDVITNGNLVSINGGAFSASNTTISPGQSIAVRGTASATAGTLTTLTINVAGVDITFAMTTAVSGVAFNPSASQPARVTGQPSAATYTFTAQTMPAGTPIIFIGPLGGAVRVSAVTLTPTGGGTAVSGTMRARTSTGDSMEIWTGNATIAAGDYDIKIDYSGGSLTSHNIFHGVLLGQSTLVPGDTCELPVASGHTSPHTATDPLTVATNGLGLIFAYDGTSSVANFTSSGGTLVATKASGSNDYGVVKITATATYSFTSTTGFSGIIGAAFIP